MPESEPPQSRCVDCNQFSHAMLAGVDLRDRCLDRRVAEGTGFPTLPEPPLPENLSGPDGRIHRFQYRFWRAPAGIVAEADEIALAPEHGYHAEVLGPHDADVGRLVAHLRTRLQRRVGHLDLVDRPGWPPMMAGDELTGRLVWSEEGEPYDVIVDGRRLTWTEFGRALEPFEGWEFRLAFEDTETIMDQDAAWPRESWSTGDAT